MPFIKSKERRKELDKVVDVMAKVEVKADGDLNYILYKYCKYIISAGYNSYKNFLGELHECECQCRQDFLIPYEIVKKNENGDV